MANTRHDSEPVNDYAFLDTDREMRLGFPEVIHGENKTSEQLIGIAERMREYASRLLITRVEPVKAERVTACVPGLQYHADAHILTGYGGLPLPERGGYITVVCAGTSDLRVAQEAAITLEIMGSRVERVTDVGVAGIHRLFARLELIRGSDVIIAIAGMEGALPSVLGGLVSKPLIAVPTSIGYGTGLNGLIALGAMLNGCAPGITVVNIDNGFGAAYAAASIHKQIRKER